MQNLGRCHYILIREGNSCRPHQFVIQFGQVRLGCRAASHGIFQYLVFYTGFPKLLAQFGHLRDTEPAIIRQDRRLALGQLIGDFSHNLLLVLNCRGHGIHLLN